jgi:hypothetical protein
MPPKPVHGPCSLGDEIGAMIEQQADLDRPLVQIRDREPLDPVTYDRAGDRERVDLIGLARLALPVARGAHPMRRDAHDPLAGGQQRLLEPARDVPAILDRPHPLLIQAARPPDRGEMPRIIRLDLPAAADPAGSLVDRRERVRSLVGVRLGVELLMSSMFCPSGCDWSGRRASFVASSWRCLGGGRRLARQR